MAPFRMKYLLFSFLCMGCASDYKALLPAAVNMDCLQKLKPAGLNTAWYDASIDVVGKHISGLLLVKNMPDSSQRVVFTNEAGVKFLDFEFNRDGQFTVIHLIRQLDKKPVIRLLKKDFELLLGIPFRSNSWKAWVEGKTVYFGNQQKNETDYFITAADCASLQGVESGTKGKRMVSILFYGSDQRQPDSIYLQHHTFAMQMKLRKLDRETHVTE
jgi:hypothetical protein